VKLSKVLEAIKDELKKPLPEPRVVSAKKRRKKMAKKAAPQVDDEEDEDLDEEEEQDEDESDEDEEEDEAPKSKSKGKKAAKPAKGKAAKSAKKSKKSEDDEGFVTLQDLASEAEIEPQSARVKLRDSDLEKPEGGRWRWKEGSKDLKAARKALGL
jgi:hypothetical protein